MACDKPDITLIVDSVEFPCNKEYLTSVSEYFRGMFDSNMKESQQSTVEIKIQDITSVQMSRLLQCSKEETISYKDLDDLCSLTRTAILLCFDKIIELCQVELLRKVSTNSCFRLMCFADEYVLTDLYKKARSHSLYFFDDIYQLRCFIPLDAHVLSSYLDDDYLHVLQEVHVLDTVLQWTAAADGRLDNLQQLLACVHWAEVTTEEISQLKIAASILKCEVWQAVMEEVGSGPGDTQEDHMLPEKCWEPRRLPVQPVLLMRSRNSNETADGEIVVTDDSGSTETLGYIPENIYYPLGAAICALGSDIYVSGGQSSFGGAWNCYMWKFSSMHLVWREVAQLPGSGYLRHHTMLSGKRQGRNVLYLVGGFQQYRIISNKAFAYQLPHGPCVELPEMSSPVFAAAACVHDNRLYVMKSKVEYLGEGDTCWTVLDCPAMPFTNRLISCCSVGGSIYVASLEELVRLDPLTGQTSKIALPSLKWTSSDESVLCAIDDCLYFWNKNDYADELRSEDEDEVDSNWQLVKYNLSTGDLHVILSSTTSGLLAPKLLPVCNIRNLKYD